MLHPACGGRTEGRGATLIRVDRWLVILEWRLSQSGLLLSQKQNARPKHTRFDPTNPTCQHVHQRWRYVTPAHFFLFSLRLHALLILFSFAAHLTFPFCSYSIICLSFTLPFSYDGPLLTSQGLSITAEWAKSWSGNGTCHLYCKHTRAHTHTQTKTTASPFWPFPSRLYVYHLVHVLLKYRADVSVSPDDVDGMLGNGRHWGHKWGCGNSELTSSLGCHWQWCVE